MRSCSREVLAAKTPNARAAAMHLVADERDYLPNAFELLAAGVRDENPRVRLEAVRGLSFFPTLGGREGGARRARIADRFVDRLHAGAHARRRSSRRGAMRIKPARWPPATSTRKKFIDAYVARRRPASRRRVKSRSW